MTNVLTTRGSKLQKADSAKILKALNDSYSCAPRVFLRFLQETGHGIDVVGICSFPVYLREEHDGIRLQVRTVNFYLVEVKARVRYLLTHSQTDDTTRARVELTLAEKVADIGVDAERCLSYEEISRLVKYARVQNLRVALIVEFLGVTVCRIS